MMPTFILGFERLMGGWFLVTVTASKERLSQLGCVQGLARSCKTSPYHADNVEVRQARCPEPT
jgi:hypothetical protein